MLQNNGFQIQQTVQLETLSAGGIERGSFGDI